MREIEFRGIRNDNGKWFYGNYGHYILPNRDWTGKVVSKPSDIHFITDKNNYNIAVNPETVGQYTGLKDCNGNKIFEGDIIKYGSCKSVVEWSNIYASFCAKGMIGMDVGLWNIKFCEVIGNIYENPEFLEVTNE